MDSDAVFIYVLIDPTTLKIRYVGSAKHCGRRHRQHASGKDGSYEKQRWVKNLKVAGYEPVMIQVDTVPVDLRLACEVFWYDWLKELGADLLNSKQLVDWKSWRFRDYIIAQLKRDHPDLADAVINGDFSAAEGKRLAVERERGYKPVRVTFNDIHDLEKVVRKLKHELTDEQIAELIALLVEDKAS